MHAALRAPPSLLLLAAAAAVAGSAGAALGGCAYHARHPVLGGGWGHGPAAAAAAATGPDRGQGDAALREVPPALARHGFFGDMGRLDERLSEARALLPSGGGEPAQRSMREAAQSLLQRMGTRGPLGGRLRNVVVFATCGALPIRPRDAAGVWLDPQAQGAALGTPAFRLEGVVYGVPDAFRQAARIEILDVGTKPLTFDFVFGTFVEVRELADGTVLLRYDPRPVPDSQRVTLWRGGCVFEPHGEGCIATEVVIFGTDVFLPLLEGALKAKVEQALSVRGQRLWKIAGVVGARIRAAAPR